MNFLQRNLHDCPSEVKATAYNAFVRPNLESSSAVWDPHQQKDINRLERVQRKGARFVTGDFRREASPTAMMDMLEWNTLQERRFVARQVAMYKAVHQQTAIAIPDYLHPTRSSTRGHHPHSFINLSTRTDQYKYSFFPRTVRCWNLLPHHIVTSATVDQFKSLLMKSISEKTIVLCPPKDQLARPRLGSHSNTPVAMYMY